MYLQKHVFIEKFLPSITSFPLNKLETLANNLAKKLGFLKAILYVFIISFGKSTNTLLN